MRAPLPGTVKVGVARLIGSSPVGWLVGVVLRQSIPNGGLRIDVSHPAISSSVKARLLWNIYERAEIRMTRKYLEGSKTVVELGSSIGVTGAHVASRLPSGGRYIGVEADPQLADLARATVKAHAAPGARIDVLVGAIDYGSSKAEVSFEGSSESNAGALGCGEGAFSVRRLSLDDLVDPDERFSLVSDIEGAEAGLILDGDLSRCDRAVFELHDTDYGGRPVSAEKMLAHLCSLGFEIVERRGNVVALNRS